MEEGIFYMSELEQKALYKELKKLKVEVSLESICRVSQWRFDILKVINCLNKFSKDNQRKVNNITDISNFN